VVFSVDFMNFDTHSGIRFRDHDVGVVDQPMSVVVDEGGEGRSGGRYTEERTTGYSRCKSNGKATSKAGWDHGGKGQQSKSSRVNTGKPGPARHFTSLHSLYKITSVRPSEAFPSAKRYSIQYKSKTPHSAFCKILSFKHTQA
jgi:hypothetical protein